MSGDSQSSFFAELKRRSVFRAGVAYLVVAWGLIEVADTVFPYLGLSERIVTFLIVFLAIGFVVTLIVSWAYELTPQGLKRDDEVEHSEEASGKPGLRAFDYVIAATLTAIIAVYAFNQLPQPTITGASIAVLPFENRSANPDDVYFVDGVHDDILTSLARISSLKVISRTSVEQYTSPDRSIPEIGEELGVTAILEGGIQRSGDTIRVNVQLIDAATDSHLWANIFDRQLTAENVFAIQSEIAKTIAEELRTAVSPEEETRLARVATENMAAYEAYLLGNQRIRRQSAVSLREAIDYFEEALELDPDFALAWVGIADSYRLLTGASTMSTEEMMPLALSAVSKAIELDPTLGEAYATLAMVHNAAETGVDPEPLFQQAIRLSPSYAPAYQFYGVYLDRQGRDVEALTHLTKALELDPLSPIINTMITMFYLDRHRPDDAWPRIQRTLESDPLYGRGFFDLSSYYNAKGQWSKALVAMNEAYRLNTEAVPSQVSRVDFHVQMGDFDAARQILDEAYDIGAIRRRVIFMDALYHALLRDENAYRFARANWDNLHVRGFTLSILVDEYLERGQVDDALILFQANDALYSLPPEMVINDDLDALTSMLYVRVLRQAGQEAEARGWLDALLEYHNDDFSPEPGEQNLTQRRLISLVEKAQVHALNGDRRAALGALGKAVDAGWSRNWIYYFEHDPAFNLIRDEADFQAMHDKVAARMAEQLRAYRAGEITVP